MIKFILTKIKNMFLISDNNFPEDQKSPKLVKKFKGIFSAIILKSNCKYEQLP